ncbi:MAG: 16S rRNA (cytosine(1402)-N(4))-methyltransferase RsmH [Bacillota bacterium]
MEYKHIPVMLNECLDGLNINPEGIYVDGTLGGAGHSSHILNRLTTGRLICNDLDTVAINNAKTRLADGIEKVTFIHDDYKKLAENLDNMGIAEVDGILLDLGVSSHQIDTPERGFAYSKDAPLDMRMNQEASLSAYDVINSYSAKELQNIFSAYGEERYSRRIAERIVSTRETSPISTTFELSKLVERCYPRGYKDGHPAKRVFQAVRIEVNGELEGLGDALTSMVRKLKKGGRLVVMTFHSLEDRIAKRCFKELELDCVCDKHLPVCICGKVSEIKILNKKPIEASEEELSINRRALSAKLRIVEKK